MATENDILAIAASQIGYSENPPNSNKTKYGAWYGMNGEPWCDMFVSWVGDQANAIDIIGKFAYCPYHVNWFKARGQWVDRSQTPEPGYVIFFANAKRIACHIGFVERVEGSTIYTIEGNTSVGNNANGGEVMRRARTLGVEGSGWYVLGYGAPAYDKTSFPIDIKEDSMQCIIQPNGEGRLVFYDGVNLHPLTHPDEVEAIQMVARATIGKELPGIPLGSPDAPWATRFFDSVKRKEE